jgi:hypothetical protein
VLFVPDRPGGGWGVFDTDGQPIPASVDTVFTWSQPMHPPNTCPTTWVEVDRTLPDVPYCYLGFVHGHFGHFIIDGRSRSWPLLGKRAAGCKLLFHGPGDWAQWRAEMPWLTDMLSALSLRESDFLLPPGPVRVPRLLIPGRSFQGQAWAHQAHQQVCRRIGEALLADVPAGGGGPSTCPRHG